MTAMNQKEALRDKARKIVHECFEKAEYLHSQDMKPCKISHQGLKEVLIDAIAQASHPVVGREAQA